MTYGAIPVSCVKEIFGGENIWCCNFTWNFFVAKSLCVCRMHSDWVLVNVCCMSVNFCKIQVNWCFCESFFGTFCMRSRGIFLLFFNCVYLIQIEKVVILPCTRSSLWIPSDVVGQLLFRGDVGYTMQTYSLLVLWPLCWLWVTGCCHGREFVCVLLCCSMQCNKLFQLVRIHDVCGVTCRCCVWQSIGSWVFLCSG